MVNFLREKIRIEEMKELKIEHKVFDDKTLFAIYKLMTKGIIKSVESLIKEGKESLVLSARGKEDEWIALKVYKIKHSDFKSMWKYLAQDPRFSKVKRDKRAVVLNWCRREFKNLKIAFEENVSCPKPIAFYENVLALQFIGEEGIPAPRLKDVKLDNYQDVYENILAQMEKLAKVKLIHTDLSSYNILIFDRPYLIDFSQSVTNLHPLAAEFLKRDIENVNNYFSKFGVRINESEDIFVFLSKIMGL